MKWPWNRRRFYYASTRWKSDEVYEAAMEYKKRNNDLVVIAGKEYGTGSSRDWAAKGTKLLGIKAVLQKALREFIDQI